MRAVWPLHLQRHRLLFGQGVFRRPRIPRQPPQGTAIGIHADTGLGHHPGGDGVIQVIAPQGRIAGGGQDFEDAAIQPQDGNIESAATQVINGENTLGVAVQTIGHRGGGGLAQ